MLKSKLRAGELDRRIVIQRYGSTPDEYNQSIPAWITLATVWASVEDRGGGESFQADQLTAYRNTVFTVRYLSTIREQMRILYNDRYYNIRLIKSPDRNRSLEITAEMLDDPSEEEAVGGGFSSGFSSGYH